MRAVLIEDGGVAVEVVDDRVFNRPVLLFGPAGNLHATPSAEAAIPAWSSAGLREAALQPAERVAR
jgi:hypothetical protein